MYKYEKLLKQHSALNNKKQWHQHPLISMKNCIFSRSEYFSLSNFVTHFPKRMKVLERKSVERMREHQTDPSTPSCSSRLILTKLGEITDYSVLFFGSFFF